MKPAHLHRKSPKATLARTAILARLPSACMALTTMLMGLTATACPLEGTWDAGWTSRAGAQFNRITLTFDCAGHGTMTATFLGGRTFTATGYRFERTGTYTVRGPSPAVPGGFEVDVAIDTFTVTYLDQNSIAGAHDPGRDDMCGDSTATLLTPRSLLGKICRGANFPNRGDIERAVMLIEGDRLYWSPFSGPDQVVIQPRNQPARRRGVVDRARPFRRS